MVKIRNGVLFLSVVAALLLLSACSKAECKTSADCKSGTCSIAKCDGGKCSYTLQKNCCGNQLKEQTENGKPGNSCTCPQDYGQCEGKGKIQIGSRTEDAAYVKYYCNEANECILGVEKNDVSSQNFLDVISNGFFKASSVIKYSKPFDAEKDSFEFRITLDDAHRDLLLPVELTKVKILYSSQYAKIEQLVAEAELGEILNELGEEVAISVPLTLDYRPQEVEEQGSMRYSIDYRYTKQVISGRDAEGNNIYREEEVRSSFTSQTKPVLFIKSEKK